MGDVWFDACSAVLLDGDKNLERVEGSVEVCLVMEVDRGDVDATARDILSRNVQVSGTTIKTRSLVLAAVVEPWCDERGNLPPFPYT